MKKACLLVLMLAYFLEGSSDGIDIASFQEQRRAWGDLDHITRGDLIFFFDHISFQDGRWEFKLSPNVRGMLWRIRNDSSDTTGTCDSGQVLNFAAGSSLEIKRSDIDLVFHPLSNTTFQVRLKIKSDSQSANYSQESEAILASFGAGYRLKFMED
ncbi:MAG TPA: hypothetical protein VGC39_04145 [Candidatus Methylacidiphilales bacterium]